VPGDSGAGQRYATVVLRNSGGSVCTIRGFGGIQLVDSGGRPLPTQQVRVQDPPMTLVRLAPGASASSELHWTVIAGPGDDQTGDCQPNPATLGVIPPDETEALSIPWSQEPVCGGGRIEQRAYAV
jgi:hypothetical protein